MVFVLMFEFAGFSNNAVAMVDSEGPDTTTIGEKDDDEFENQNMVGCSFRKETWQMPHGRCNGRDSELAQRLAYLGN